jgi:hypothetical protein
MLIFKLNNVSRITRALVEVVHLRYLDSDEFECTAISAPIWLQVGRNVITLVFDTARCPPGGRLGTIFEVGRDCVLPAVFGQDQRFPGEAWLVISNPCAHYTIDTSTLPNLLTANTGSRSYIKCRTRSATG